MTPKHQQVIDATMLLVWRRSLVLSHALRTQSDQQQADEESVQSAQGTQSALDTDEAHAALIERLRASVLGQRLRRIAEYVEGYPAEIEPTRTQDKWSPVREEHVQGGMRREVYQVCEVVYGEVREKGKRWRYPKHCQHTELGKLLHAALLQFYREYLPAKQLVSVAAAAKEIGIARQTLHEWMAKGRVKWIYEEGRDIIWLDCEDVDRLWHMKLGLRSDGPKG
ncbi:hypothetical protein ccbrp13_71080 [Ktedonobacteria bacterium brp13]|nr:hypothetical protein ccbrp13_71080 [Ktedonobacteria bacterium brp13]